MKIISLTLATILVLTGNAIARAEDYKTDKDKVVVGGLESQKQYDINTVNAKGKQGKRQKKSNGCGQLLIDDGTKYKSISVAGRSIDPATLTTKQHQRCQPNKKNRSTKNSEPTPSTPKNKTSKLKLPATSPSPSSK
jgi:hypothetical protein